MITLFFEYTKNGLPVIRVDDKTFFCFSNPTLNYLPPWETISLNGIVSTTYKGNTINERVTEHTKLNKISFKNRTKNCVHPDILKHVIHIVKKYINERGFLTESAINSIKEEIVIPFEIKEKHLKRGKK